MLHGTTATAKLALLHTETYRRFVRMEPEELSCPTHAFVPITTGVIEIQLNMDLDLIRVERSRPFRVTHPKAGLEAGTKAEAEAKKADKQNATFILE